MFNFISNKEFKNRKVKIRFKENIEPEEIFLDKIAKEKEERLAISEKKIEVPLPQKVLKGIFLSIIFLMFFLLFRTFQFQILKHKHFLAKAKENKFIVYSIEASRGVIYDSKGRQLVFNKPSFNLVFNKKKLSEIGNKKEDLFQTIAKIIDVEKEEIEKKINESTENEVLISENLDHQKLILLEAKIKDFPGFQIQKNFVREYKEGEIFSHVIGYMGKISPEELKENQEFYSPFDYVGRAGIEKFYENVLRKDPGKVVIERDVYGNIISQKTISLPKPGKSLELWINLDFQKKVAEELRKKVKELGAKEAVAVALDPNTGGVLALVNIPTYDNNIFTLKNSKELIKEILERSDHPLFNRAVAGRYPTGSTIKPLIACAALEEKIISPLKKINCQGKIVIPHKYNPEISYTYNDWTVHGPTDIRKAIAESCNIYFYTIGGGYKDQEGLGPSRIKKYLELFGWGSKTGIDLPEEKEGFIPTPEWKKLTKKEGWWDGDTYNLSIGQGDIGITPLEVVTAFQAIANGGKIFQPHVVHKILDNNKNVIEEIGPKILRENFIDPKNIQIIREGMRRAVTGEGAPHASSVLLNNLPVSAAAKTGTAQIPKKDYYNNWVTVFAPYEHPQIVLTIMIGEIKGVQAAALPVAREVLNWYFSQPANDEDSF